MLQFELGCGPGDWNYPWDLCGSLYRTGDACSVVRLIHERFRESGGGLACGRVCRGSVPNRNQCVDVQALARLIVWKPWVLSWPHEKGIPCSNPSATLAAAWLRASLERVCMW